MYQAYNDVHTAINEGVAMDDPITRINFKLPVSKKKKIERVARQKNRTMTDLFLRWIARLR